MLEIISATRLSPTDFWAKSALGLSLGKLLNQRRKLRAKVSFSNRKGLPDIYNARIVARDAADAAVFMHDDVWIEDSDFVERVHEGLARFDVIGVAGCRRRRHGQPAWAFDDFGMLTHVPNEDLSGAISHGPSSPGVPVIFGDWPQECELLDGVFLAANVVKLREQGVMFDPRFKFHFYDMDFCRSARQQGLTMGTWPVHLTHQSGGAFGSPAWAEHYRHYLAKWEL
jgi:GT2 family glycosyltransferase